MPSNFVVVSLPAMISREQEADDLFVGEGFAVGLGRDERGGEVVATGVSPAIGDECGEVFVELVRGFDAFGGDVGIAFFAVQQRVAPLAQLMLVAVGHTEHFRDDVHREQRRVVADQIDLVSVAHGIEIPDRKSADRRFEIGDAPRREGPADEPAQPVWSGGSVVSSIGSGLPSSSVMPIARAEGVGVVERADHVVVAGERPEAELVVVVAGRLVAQGAVDRKRVVVELVARTG